MGMGFSACSADVITWEQICEIIPEESAAFRRFVTDIVDFDEFLEALGESARFEDWDNFQQNFPSADVDDDDAENLLKKYHEFCEVFSAATMVGESKLTLGISKHEKEDRGDRYDEVDGIFWYIDGAYGLTAAGEKFKNMFERKHYVSHG